MKFRISIFLIAGFFLLEKFTFAADLSVKDFQKLITQKEDMGELAKFFIFKKEDRQDKVPLEPQFTNPLLAQAYDDVMRATEKWLKSQEKDSHQANFVFTISPRGYPVGRMREYDPKPSDEEILRLHKDPERCYKMGLEFLKDADSVPSHLETAKVWLQRAADQGHGEAQTKLQTLKNH